MMESGMESYEKWKEDFSRLFGDLIPLKRCPQCGSLDLRYNHRIGRLYCVKCGFEVNVPQAYVERFQKEEKVDFGIRK